MRTTIRFPLTLAAAALATAALGWLHGARADEAAPLPPKDPAACCKPVVCDPPPPGCPCPTTCLPDPLLKIGCFDECIAQFKEGKAASCFKLGAGAYHWVNIQTDDDKVTYGYPGGGEGTYFYYFNVDLECPTCDPCGPKFGAHAQLRARDQTVFRSFFDEQVWFYEAYGYVDLPRYGKVKAGKVWKRFGLDWDGTFWGNVPYYDGMKLDPDWGVSWENTWRKGNRFEIDTFAQFFLEEDEVNGSLAGGDAESSDALDEKNTFVARIVPRYWFNTNTSLAVGVSGLFGTVERRAGGPDEDLTQFAVDVEFAWCGLKAFAEIAHSDGIQHATHYVTLGPSDVYDSWMVGIQYKWGPFTPRIVYSHGEYENPGGEQDLLLIGGTIALTNWLTLYLEYVDWTVNTGGPDVVFEDGYQIVLNWDV